MFPKEPAAAARSVGLHYVADTQPGIRRRLAGEGFLYQDAQGARIRDPDVLRRIAALRIPPAWSDVWICPRPDGPMQATGRDARGRKQYRYHPDWHAVRDAAKFDRMIAFGDTLPRLRARVEQDLALTGLPRHKVLATVVRLLETTLIRIGNVAYARENKSFGLTTMRDRHVQVSGTALQFQFRGKSGKHHTVRVHDRRLARIVRRCQELPGYELFQYLDADGRRQSIDSSDVNAYLRDITGQDFTAKDVRTWAGTVVMACTLWEYGMHHSAAQAKKHVVQAIDTVAKRLGNTRAVCRKCYIHPEILQAYLDRTLAVGPAAESETYGPDLLPEEVAVLAFLKERAEPQARRLSKTG